MNLKCISRVHPPGMGWSLFTKTCLPARQAFLIMKLSIVLLITACLQVQAAGFAQKISLNEKNTPLASVFKQIRKQTGYYIFYKDEVLKQAGNPKITIQVNNVTVEEALSQCLSNLPLTYSIVEKTIIVKPKSDPPAVAETPAPRATITGVIKDENGNPLPGVSIRNKRTGGGTSTDAEGKFSITAELNDVLVITYIGYESQQVTVTSLQQQIDVTMKVSASELESTVVVAYGSQKRKAVTNAVSSVASEEIVTTKNENVQNMLTGKVAGLNVVQNTAEPGSFNNSINIRGLGEPLVVIDGVPRDNMTRIDPNEIESVSVLKDAAAAMYGVRAANGVILITTKRGKKGTLQLNYSGNFGLQFPSGMPKPLDAIGYMTLVNQQQLHNVNGGQITYTPEDFEDYRSGAKKSYDWYNAVVAKSFEQTQHNLSATGGNENTTYFLSLGYTYQNGMLKSNDLNYKRYNVRSNITSNLTKNLTVDLNLNGIFDTKNQPWEDAWWIIRSIWRQNPLDPFYANEDPDRPFQGSVDGTNPISLSNSAMTGYKTYNNRWFQSSINITYKIPYIQGLSARAMYSYDYRVSENKLFQKEYNQYTYDEASDSYTRFVRNSPNSIRREYIARPSMLSQLSLNYDQTFGSHHVSALALYEESSRQSDNFYGFRQLSLPVDQLLAGNALNQLTYADTADLFKFTNRALVGRLNYSFQSKYLAEVSFRYDGSSRFPTSGRWGFFPAASVGWRISEENFWKNTEALSFINSFKVRASYGKLGDDKDARYQFLSGYYYPAAGDNNRLPPGSVFDGNFVNSLQSTGIPNPGITWYESKTFDVGLDAEAWNGLLGVTVDFFNRDRSGLLWTRDLSLPGVVGADLPQENLNSDRTQGFDLEVNHRNRLGDFSYFAKAIFSYSRRQIRYFERARAGNSYLNWYNDGNNGNLNNRWAGVYWGYGDAGRFTSFEDIYNVKIAQDRGWLPGDYIMEDWNGDGQISELDIHPIGYSGIPLIQYGLTLGGSYKGFDLNLLLQGAAKANVAYFEQLNTPLWGSNRSSALEQFMDNWHPADPNADPYDPNTVWVSGRFPYTGTVPPTNSVVNMQNAAYIRLKTVELGYTLPSTILSRIGVKGVRVYVNGYNLVTLTKLKYLDPEHPSDTYGYLYPLNKSVSGGINVNF